jgi:hypothetical protein
MSLQKAADSKDCGCNRWWGGLVQDGKQVKLDVLSALHFTEEAWRLITSTTIKNCFVNCGFSVDHVSSNVDSGLKLTEFEEDD